MKKLVSFLAAVLFALSALGCSAPAVSVDLNPINQKPWSGVRYEKSVYTVEKWTQELVDKTYRDKVKVAEGQLVIEIFVDEVLGTTEQISRVKNTFYIQYLDVPEAVVDGINHRGIKDEIVSEVEFSSTTLQPKKSSKIYTSPVRKDADGKNKDDLSFSFTADYGTNKAVIKKDGKDTNVSLSPKGQYFDNEQLYVMIRDLKGLNYKSTLNFSIAHVYDSYLAKDHSYRQYTVGAAVKDTAVTLDAPEALQKYLTPDEQDGKYKVKCMQVAVGLNVNSYPTPGPDFSMFISEPDLKFNIGPNVTTNKVLMKMQTVEFDVPNAKERFHTNYVLSDYTNLKA